MAAHAPNLDDDDASGAHLGEDDWEPTGVDSATIHEQRAALHARALWVPGDAIAPIPPRLRTIELNTRRLQETVDWYSKVLGARLESQGAGRATLRVESTLLQMIAAHDHAPIANPATLALGFEYASIDDLLETYLRLKPQRLEPAQARDSGTVIGLRYHDPDGREIELYASRPGRPAPFAAAEGRIVDPDVLVEQRIAELKAAAP